MKNSVVRLSLMGLLAGLLVTPVLAHRNSIPCHKKPAQFGTVEPVHSIQVLGHLASSSGAALPKSTKTGSVLIADGPDPVPWPKKLTAEPRVIADGPDPVPWPKKLTAEPQLIADGGDPVPWPKPKAMKAPNLLADGGDPVPWPKPKAMKEPKLLADGGDPVPWPKTPTKLADKC